MGIAETGTEPRTGAAVAVRDAAMTYRRGRTAVDALAPTSLDVRPGEFVSLIGPSGCGKSTLLKIIAGLLAATGGGVEIDGRTVTEPPPGVSVAFQKPTLLSWRTIRQNILLPVELRGGERAAADRRADELLATMRLTDFAGSLPRELSGGMEQRAAIARSLIDGPRLLLMDEPFGALDEFTREDLNDELLRVWHDEPKTVLFVTHSISEAVYLSDRIVVMRARPGGIHEVIDIDLPRPRRREARGTAEFFEATQRVRASLEQVKSQ
ncbi:MULTISPECIES: ABC transporter ATP-binding protein [Actinomadura]|uniref:ABC transporter ATP-binding protein n=1 Tax=Actinomadura TaxID=1988 RepID=UPI00041708B6|nr:MULTISPECIES: ABC transporter ATP-binding protein [Actinomadura]